MRHLKRTILFASLTVVLTIAILEVILHILAFASPRVDGLLSKENRARAISPTLPDEQLGYRPNPAFPNHDAKGFRNPSVPDSAEIVALGDSQTYGTGVAAHEAWPRQLEAYTSKSVYAMAFGGYGPVHSLLLIEEAFELKPSTIIATLYTGNDFFDTFLIVHNHDRAIELRTVDAELQRRIAIAEEAEPILEKVNRARGVNSDEDAPASARSDGDAATDQAETGSDLARILATTRGFLSNNSTLYGLIRRIKVEIERRIADPVDRWNEAKSFAEANSDFCEVFDGGEVKTILTPGYRAIALDIEDPRIFDGYQISMDAIRHMSARAAENGMEFMLLIIPTKELVFKDVYEMPSSTFTRLVQREEEVLRMAEVYLEDNEIRYVNALPALRRQLSSGPQPYDVSHDGHPSKHGHAAIARLVAKVLTE